MNRINSLVVPHLDFVMPPDPEDEAAHIAYYQQKVEQGVEAIEAWVRSMAQGAISMGVARVWSPVSIAKATGDTVRVLLIDHMQQHIKEISSEKV